MQRQRNKTSKTQSADCRPPPTHLWSRYTVYIWSPDMQLDFVSGWLPKFNGDFLVKSFICGKILMKM